MSYLLTEPTCRSEKQFVTDFAGPKPNDIAELMEALVEETSGVLTAAGKRYQMHDPSTWAKQSKLLAQGKLEELAKLQGELKGGKKA